MSLQILERRGLERARRMERLIEHYAKQREKIDKKREPARQKSAKDIAEESRAKLEKRGFGRRD